MVDLKDLASNLNDMNTRIQKEAKAGNQENVYLLAASLLRYLYMLVVDKDNGDQPLIEIRKADK